MVRAKRRFGQHFLHHRAILERIVQALDPAVGDVVLEIGPGQGSLTEVLARSDARVIAIEKDRDLAPMVQGRLPSVRVVLGDALELDWRSSAGVTRDYPFLVTGNIPYRLTSALLAKALEPPRPVRVVFLVQEEVADRLVASPGTGEYGALTVGVQALAKVEKLFRVGAGAFHPRPRVDSAVVRLTPLTRPLVTDAEAPLLRRLVVGLFGFRRKQLVRGLRELTGWLAERVTGVLEQAKLEPAARPETIPPAGFVNLLRVLIDAGWSPR